MQYVASISYGKDSLAMLHVIKDILHKPLDRIVTAEVWATDTIQADLPPMVAFKDKADQIIRERWGIEVEHFFATDKDGEKVTYEKMFYHIPKKIKKNKTSQNTEDSRSCGYRGAIHDSKRPLYKGFPNQRRPWCPKLKYELIKIGNFLKQRKGMMRQEKRSI